MGSGENVIWEAAQRLYEAAQATGNADPAVAWNQLTGEQQAEYVAKAQET